MGLIDLLAGRPAPARFARIVTRALRRHGVQSPVRFDPQEFCLEIGEGADGHRFLLGNAYEQYPATPRLRPFVHTVLQSRVREA